MTAKKFLLFSFLQLLFFTLLKIGYFKYQLFANPGTQAIAFWVITAVLAAALVRRLGVISYMEAVFIMIFWTAFDGFADLLLTSVFTGLGMFSNVAYWAGLGVMDVIIFLFHKKRHVHVRHELHTKAQGHHPAGHSHKSH